jgi:hypothetical protein
MSEPVMSVDPWALYLCISLAAVLFNLAIESIARWYDLRTSSSDTTSLILKNNDKKLYETRGITRSISRCCDDKENGSMIRNTHLKSRLPTTTSNYAS